MANNPDYGLLDYSFVLIQKILSSDHNFILVRFVSSRGIQKPHNLDAKLTNTKKKLNKNKTNNPIIQFLAFKPKQRRERRDGEGKFCGTKERGRGERDREKKERDRERECR